jgi:hypothetical protein
MKRLHPSSRLNSSSQLESRYNPGNAARLLVLSARAWQLAPHAALAILAILALGNPLFAKRKDDVVVMKNGDRFTGEIKSLSRGILSFKSSYMLESVQLDWVQVDRIQSQDQFFVALKDGRRVTGLIEKPSSKEGQPGVLRIESQGKPMEIEQQDVIMIEQREGNFWSQLNGTIDYGMAFTSGDNALNSTLAAGVQYQKTKSYLGITTSSQFNTQSSGSTANRFTFDGQYFRLLYPRWFYGGLLDLLKSDQQNLNLRSTVGGVVGHAVILTDKTNLRIFGGAVFSRESYFQQAGTTPVNQTAEGVVGATFNAFRFKVLDVRSTLLIYPSMSDPGRVRVSSDSNVHVEIVKDFYWDFHFYENFDSRPPITAPRNDLGISTGIGWKF